MALAKATQRQIVAEISPLNKAGVNPPDLQGSDVGPYFTTVSGGEISAAVEKVYDGGAPFPVTLCAPSEIGDITVSRFVTTDSGEYTDIKSLRQLVGKAHYDVTVYTLNCDLKEPGSERVYPEALLVGLTEPDGDASSGAPATFSLTFAISEVE